MEPPRSLSHRLERTLRSLVVRGELPAGQRVNEVGLARQLSVSRTPLREALTRLSGEGFVAAEPHRGFFVPPLSAQEVEPLYAIRARLDPWALELSGLPDKKTLRALEQQNRELAAPADVEQTIALDDQWHLALIAGCGNPVLLELIQQMMWRTRRYEYAYMMACGGVSTAIRQHRLILAALRDGDLAAAIAHLRDNLTAAVPALLAWVRESTRR
jgi:DNA-binding GntR family transcriptional regulator